MNFKYGEDRYIVELETYVSNTYGSHYVGEDNIQALDLIFATGHGQGFCIGNILKYASRYGKKKGYNRDDLMKVLHYTLLMLRVHDSEHQVSTPAVRQQPIQQPTVKDIPVNLPVVEANTTAITLAKIADEIAEQVPSLQPLPTPTIRQKGFPDINPTAAPTVYSAPEPVVPAASPLNDGPPKRKPTPLPDFKGF